MNLRDWMYNNNSVMKEIPSDDRANQGPMKILGPIWYIESDMIGLNKKINQASSNLTKREVLKQISLVYDLLGLFSPVTPERQIFIQSSSNKRFLILAVFLTLSEWDEALPVQDDI